MDERPIMVPRTARMSGAYVAECPECGAVCAYWEDEDLDEDGNLRCDACERDAVHEHECRDCGEGFDCDGYDGPNGCDVFRGTCPDCDESEVS
jgi:hypothetical protein